ncbi:SPW repeat protein [Polaromonas sp. JS666]|uniref:SPW repeat protein n=1 Tax=Polaromonas sp. (strain JS666 / ATCC BAA-500) TaxID=296591 RepID=UPI0003261760|nr:SPW repeat protein [Polaromonas sp. JS666]
MKQPKHWQDPLNALIGVWVILSPWALGFQDIQMAMANAVVIGVALLAAGLGATFVPRAWEEWTEGAIGLWLMASPWALGFSMHRNAMLSALIAGIAVVALALWTLLTDEDYNGWWRDRTAH